MQDKELKEFLCCSICLEVFTDPVVNEHGQSYDRECIKAAYKQNHNLDPNSKKKSDPNKLIQNTLLLKIIEYSQTTKFDTEERLFPTEFFCKLTGKILEKPVVLLEDGDFTIESRLFTKTIQLRKGDTCDESAIKGANYYPNYYVKSLISAYTKLGLSTKDSKNKGEIKMQKLFSQDFINEQREVFTKYSKQAGEFGGLLNSSDAEQILKYMQLIETPERDNNTCVGLFKLLNLKMQEFLKKSNNNYSHPYYKALSEVKDNVTVSIKSSQPTVKKNLIKTLEQQAVQKRQAQNRKARDCFNLMMCGIWLPIQKVITFGDCCGSGCDNSTPCNPVRKIKELKNDLQQQDNIIKSIEEDFIPLQRLK